MDYALKKGKDFASFWPQFMPATSQAKPKRKPNLQVVKPDFERSVKAKNFWIETGLETAMISLFLFGLFQGYLFLTRSPHFQVSKVTISGNQAIGDKLLLGNMQPIRGQNIFKLDLADMAKRLDEHPWVRNVSIERKLPNQIGIHIEERKPFARILLGKEYIMDNFGAIIAEADPEYSHLPLIQGITAQSEKLGEVVSHQDLMPGLQVLHYLNRLAFFRNDPIASVKLTDSHRALFITSKRKTEIALNLLTMEESFENLKIVLELLGPKKINFDFIDLSFKNKVVVKPGSSNRIQNIQS